MKFSNELLRVLGNFLIDRHARFFSLTTINKRVPATRNKEGVSSNGKIDRKNYCFIQFFNYGAFRIAGFVRTQRIVRNNGSNNGCSSRRSKQG